MASNTIDGKRPTPPPILNRKGVELWAKQHSADPPPSTRFEDVFTHGSKLTHYYAQGLRGEWPQKRRRRKDPIFGRRFHLCIHVSERAKDPPQAISEGSPFTNDPYAFFA